MFRSLVKVVQILAITLGSLIVLVLLTLIITKYPHEFAAEWAAGHEVAGYWNRFRSYVIENAILITPFIFAVGSLTKFLYSNIRKRKHQLVHYVRAQTNLIVSSVDQLVAEMKDEPRPSVSYISAEADGKSPWLNVLRENEHILIMGISGIGKSREVLEYLQADDTLPGSIVVIRTGNKKISEHIAWPETIHFRQRPAVLFLDNIEDYDATDDEDQYNIKDDPAQFERILEVLIEQLKRRCNDLKVIITIRSESDAWKNSTVGRRRNSFWRTFRQIELPPHGFDEGVRYCTEMKNQFTNLEIEPSAVRYLAENYDGLFVSIRDYLSLKNTNADASRVRLRLSIDDVGDFNGVYPTDWERRYYDTAVRGSDPAEAIFAALSLVDQARIEFSRGRGRGHRRRIAEERSARLSSVAMSAGAEASDAVGSDT